MKTKLKNRLKNWRWWVIVIPFSIIILLISLVQCVSIVFSFLANITNIIDMTSPKIFKKAVKWVNGNNRG
jgi:hypothetical protein